MSGRTIPDLKLSLQLKRHVCIELSYLESRLRSTHSSPGATLAGVSRPRAVMINSLENPIHINLLEELFSDRQGLGSSEHAQQPSFLPLRYTLCIGHKLGYSSGT